nr:MAG TPA: hypothetical protein [Caudoviricetes sp.]
MCMSVIHFLNICVKKCMTLVYDIIIIIIIIIIILIKI